MFSKYKIVEKRRPEYSTGICFTIYKRHQFFRWKPLTCGEVKNNFYIRECLKNGFREDDEIICPYFTRAEEVLTDYINVLKSTRSMKKWKSVWVYYFDKNGKVSNVDTCRE